MTCVNEAICNEGSHRLIFFHLCRNVMQNKLERIMGRKIFISYKYSDSKVPQSSTATWTEPTTARHYVDALQDMLESDDHINKGEKDDEDLADFAEETIASKLRDKIYDSSITIVVVSKGMKTWEAEIDQWIPWEIAYSLKEHSRDGRASKTNGVLALVLPDELGSYSYYIEDNSCPYCKCRTLNTHVLFGILRDNMFNHKMLQEADCDNHAYNKVYTGSHSYIPSVKWIDFCADPMFYLDYVTLLKDDVDNFNIVKQV